MTPRICSEIRPQLAWFVGDDLDADRGAVVRVHLRECAECRREASALQQSRKGLQALAGAEHAGVDEAMFSAMHASIVDRVEREAMPGGSIGDRDWAVRNWAVRTRRLLPMAAAVALFLFGWWMVREPAGLSVFDRQPIGSSRSTEGPGVVVPYVGSRVPLRLLGDESGTGGWAGAEGGLGLGMMGRWRLRTLEDGEILLPTGPASPDPDPATPERGAAIDRER